MFLRCSKRLKDGKEHLYWSVVENRRLLDGRVVQRHVLYLGELNGRQEASWRKSVELFGQEDDAPQQVALFPEEFAPVESGGDALPIVRVRLAAMSLRRPRQWGACWLGCELWRQLGLDTFWGDRLHASRKGTRWDLILQTLVLYRLIDPGSEWRLPFGFAQGLELVETAPALVRSQCHRRLARQRFPPRGAASSL